MGLSKGLHILRRRFCEQGLRVTAMWAADHAVRIVSGVNIRSLSQITPELHVGGQYHRRGCRAMQGRGITAVVNLRIEFDDQEAGIAPSHYLHLPTVDDGAPSLKHLEEGSSFMVEQVAHGGSVYVHCGSGIGRAPTMAAAYLVETGLTPDEAWDRIRQVRPFIRPTTVQVERLEQFAALE